MERDRGERDEIPMQPQQEAPPTLLMLQKAFKHFIKEGHLLTFIPMQYAITFALLHSFNALETSLGTGAYGGYGTDALLALISFILFFLARLERSSLQSRESTDYIMYGSRLSEKKSEYLIFLTQGLFAVLVYLQPLLSPFFLLVPDFTYLRLRAVPEKTRVIHSESVKWNVFLFFLARLVAVLVYSYIYPSMHVVSAGFAFMVCAMFDSYPKDNSSDIMYILLRGIPLNFILVLAKAFLDVKATQRLSSAVWVCAILINVSATMSNFYLMVEFPSREEARVLASIGFLVILVLYIYAICSLCSLMGLGERLASYFVGL